MRLLYIKRYPVNEGKLLHTNRRGISRELNVSIFTAFGSVDNEVTANYI